MSARDWPAKHPDARLDYTLLWRKELTPGDVIETSTWEVPAGLTTDSDVKTDTTTTIWLSGGVDGTTYELTNHVVTRDGRDHYHTISLPVST